MDNHGTCYGLASNQSRGINGDLYAPDPCNKRAGHD